jgi:hypothetical protein
MVLLLLTLLLNATGCRSDQDGAVFRIEFYPRDPLIGREWSDDLLDSVVEGHPVLVIEATDISRWEGTGIWLGNAARASDLDEIVRVERRKLVFRLHVDEVDYWGIVSVGGTAELHGFQNLMLVGPDIGELHLVEGRSPASGEDDMPLVETARSAWQASQ